MCPLNPLLETEVEHGTTRLQSQFHRKSETLLVILTDTPDSFENVVWENTSVLECLSGNHLPLIGKNTCVGEHLFLWVLSAVLIPFYLL